MQCPKCGSKNVNVQAVSITKSKGRGALWWCYFLMIGWIIEVFLWIFLTIPRLFLAMIGKNKKITTKVETQAICQECGHRWTIK